MNVKDDLVQALRDNGHDLITACEHAQKALDSFRDSGDYRRTLQIGNRTLRLQNYFITYIPV